MDRKVWIFVEIEGRTTAKVLELISEARKLASKLNGASLLLGHDVEELHKILSYGPDNVYLVDHPLPS